MNEKSKKNSIVLIACMIVSLILTYMLFTNSIECVSCYKKITGKYYVTMSGYPYCKDCGEKHYRGWPGDLDNITDRVDNTTRNVLWAVEIVGFIAAMVFVNNAFKNKLKDSDENVTSGDAGAERDPAEYLIDVKTGIQSEVESGFDTDTDYSQREDEKSILSCKSDRKTMGNSIKKAQNALFEYIKNLPFGEIFMKLAPVFIIIRVVDHALDFCNVIEPEGLVIFLSISYYMYMLAMIACFATDKLMLIVGMLGIRAVSYIVSMAKYGLHMTSIIGFVGDVFMACLFYYVYLHRNSVE